MKIIGFAFLISFLISFISGPMFLPVLRKLKFGQTIREDGPQSHLSKNGTPTMGGLVFIMSSIIASAIAVQFDAKIAFPIVCFILFGLVGFIDDYIKVVLKRNLGLRAYQKIVLQLIFSFIIAYWQYKISPDGTKIFIPFFKVSIDFGVLYIPFIIFFILAVTNGLNLTDGLDGLATLVTIPVCLCFIFISYFVFNDLIIAAFMAALAGGLVGFLRVNKHPAKVFMGDVGSMALGGAVAAAAIYFNLEFLILIVGLIYLLESLSVIIQVLYFKATGGKRFFRMAPLHHHFEEGGMSETKVVAAFSAVTWVMAIIAVLSII